MSGPREPWYKDGLQFSCQPGCRRCCGGEPGYVWVNEDEIAAIARNLRMDADEFERIHVRTVYRGEKSLKEKKNGDCVLLNEHGCSVYEARPQQCRDYPFWPEVLKSWAAWAREKERCPGIGEGELHTAPKLTELLKRQDALD
ncbi:MAG: YkgJ family cysteine cluster protein [Planctomycetota bacterium]|nr:YkgJ family cysteine cluster protein [Planctomycetota bacterium]